MAPFRICLFAKREDEFAESPKKLEDALHFVKRTIQGRPNLNKHFYGEGRALWLGLGGISSTIQCIDKLKRISYRAVSGSWIGPISVFKFDGQSTFIPSKYLVDEETAIKAAVTWISTDELMPELEWLSSDYPFGRYPEDA